MTTSSEIVEAFKSLFCQHQREEHGEARGKALERTGLYTQTICELIAKTINPKIAQVLMPALHAAATTESNSHHERTRTLRVCTFRKRSDPFRTHTSDPWVDPLRPGKGSHSDRPRAHSDRNPSSQSDRAQAPLTEHQGSPLRASAPYRHARFFLAMAWKSMGAGTIHHSPHLSSWDSIERRWKPFIKPGPLPLCDVIERHVGLSMLLNPAPCHHAMAQLASPTHFRRNHPSHHGVP